MRTYTETRKIRFGKLPYLIFVFTLLPPLPALPDLGSLVAKSDAGPYRVSVLVAPSPLRVGPAVFSLAVRDRASQNPVTDAEILLTLSPPHAGGAESGHMHHNHSIQAKAHPSQSRHPGLASALIELPKAGTWTGQVSIQAKAGKQSFHFELPVGPPQPPWIDYWAAFGLPVVGGLLFIWHQRRVRSRKREPEP